jgi:hypothetical protein
VTRSSDPSEDLDPGDLRDYLQWAAVNPGFSLTAYAYHKLTPDLTVAVTRLFFPSFTSHAGGVFFADGFDAVVFDQWMAHFHGDLTEVERMMNHRHVRDLFGCSEQMSEAAIRYVGSILAQCWSCALRSQLPEVRAVIRGEWNEDDQDVVIVMYQQPRVAA